MKKTIAIATAVACVLCSLAIALDSQSVTYKGDIGGDQGLINLQDATPVTQIMPWPNAAWTNTAGAPTNRFQPTSMTSIYWPTTDANGHRLAYILFTNPPTTLIGLTPTFDQAVTVIATITTNTTLIPFVASVTTNTTLIPFVATVTTSTSIMVALNTLVTNIAGTAGNSSISTYTFGSVTNWDISYTFKTSTNYALSYTFATSTNYSIAWTTRVVSNYNDTVLLTNTYTFYHSNLWMNTTGVTSDWKMVH